MKEDMEQNQEREYQYQVGGSLHSDAPSYVERQGDRDLYHALINGQFCYVLNSRQTGKSSLRVRIMHRLTEEGFHCGAIDLTRLGSENLTSGQWYKGIISELWRAFGLMGLVNLKSWFRELGDLSPVQQLSRFLEDILLALVPGRIFIFIDEIDSVLTLNFATDDFFALIRFCYNQRAENSKYHRLTFALFGVTTPADLIVDRKRTPFNIGKAIELQGFRLEEVQPLINGFEGKVDNSRAVLREILHWTQGQPFLTQKLCQLFKGSLAGNESYFPVIGNQESPFLQQLMREVLTQHRDLAVRISTLVQSQIIDNWEVHDDPEHLKTIRDRLLSDRENRSRLLQLYRQILEQGKLKGDPEGIRFAARHQEQVDLLLSGLVVKQSGELQVYNPIYRAVFNLSWVEQQLAKFSGENSSYTGEEICTAFIKNLDQFSLGQIEAVGKAIAIHSPEQAAAIVRAINEQFFDQR